MRALVTAMHLIMDGYSSNHELLKDEKLIYEILDRYPKQIGLIKIAPPSVHTYIGKIPENWGVSGIVLVAEGHIGIHTWVEHRFVNLDIFSCNSFDAAGVLKDLLIQTRCPG